MKFESKFGLGEIVSYSREREQKTTHDELLEVIGVMFQIDGSITYAVRGHRGLTMHFAECELEGDPDFDQENGYQE